MCYIDIQNKKCWLPSIIYKDIEPWLKQFDCGCGIVVPYDTWYLAFNCHQPVWGKYLCDTVARFNELGFIQYAYPFPVERVSLHIFLFCYPDVMAQQVIDRLCRAYCNTNYIFANPRDNKLEKFKAKGGLDGN